MLTDLGRAAVIITGELRTWYKAKKYIFNFFDATPIKVDYFFVTWNESSDYWFSSNKSIRQISQDEIKQSFVNQNLVSFRIEEVLSNRHKEASTFYLKSHLSKIANVLKRRHEFNNNFVYDYVIEIRPDLFITPATSNPVKCSDFEIVLDEFWDDNGLPVLPDIYFRSNSFTNDILATRNTYYNFKELEKFTDLIKQGSKFVSLLSTFDPHYILFSFITKRKIIPVHKVKQELGHCIVYRPNVPDQEYHSPEEIYQYEFKFFNSKS